MAQVDSIDLYRHGGRVDDARRLFPAAPEPWLDLSTGINPRAWRPPVDVPCDMRALPPVSALRGLEEAAAAFFGTDPVRVAAVPGSELALRLLPALECRLPITAVMPGYGTHADVAGRHVTAERLNAHIGERDTLLLANPNNPDGRMLTVGALREIMDRQSRADGWLVVDEAFADAHAEASIVPLVPEAGRLLVFRSFGKFFGLAGLRLGFVIGPPVVIARLRGLLGDWPVSAQAIALGTAAYRDRDWITRTRTRLMEDAAALDRVLAARGLRAGGACPLFRLVDHADAAGIFNRLAAAGILVRPFHHQPSWLRFGLPAAEVDLERLDRALADG